MKLNRKDYNASIPELAKAIENLKTDTENIQSRVLYTWIAYADDDKGTGIALDPDGKSYVGIATNRTVEKVSIEDPSIFTWSKAQGDTGRGISSITIRYQISDSGTEAPTGTWHTAVQSPTTLKPYLWTRMYITYSGGSPATQELYSVSKMGTSGTSVTVSSIRYQEGSSATETPTGTWSDTVVAVAEGKYLWVKTTFSDGSEAYSVAKQGTSGKDGTNGTNGTNGKDGVSPVVTLTKTDGVTTITITDATGTHSQTVKDGADGTSIKGDDGKTAYFHVKYSNDGGKTFTGNSGEDVGDWLGSYTDNTEADSTSVGSYTWVKIKGEQGIQGEQGDKGADAPTITSMVRQYYSSDSETSATGGSWSADMPEMESGKYLWTRWQITWSTGDITYSDEAYDATFNGLQEDVKGASDTVSSVVTKIEETESYWKTQYDSLSASVKTTTDWMNANAELLETVERLTKVTVENGAVKFDFDEMLTKITDNTETLETRNKYVHIEDDETEGATIVIGDSSSGMVAEFTKSALNFKSGDTVIASYANDGLSVENMITRNQILFEGHGWAIRPGSEVSSGKFNLNDVWIGG